MAKNVLFLVHGMGWNTEAGPDGKGWFAEAEKELRAGWRLFPSLAERSFDKYIELVPIHYDNVFRSYLDQIGDAASHLQAKLGDASYAKVVGAISGAGAEAETFFWANVMDVLLYRFGGDLYRNVHVAIGQQIAERVRRDWASVATSSTQFSLLSHSLGTAAVHGALNRLGGGRIAGSDALRLGGNFKLHCYMTLANVSRVLWRGQGSIYDKTIVRPQALGADYVRRFINVRHIADPIPAPMRFAPRQWGSGYGELELRHVRNANLHGYTHYLCNPRVAAALFGPLLPPDMLEPAEVAAVVAKYHDVDHDSPDKRAEVAHVIDQVALSLRQAYGDEQHLLTDSAELLAKLIRKAWECREKIGSAIGVVS